MATVTSEALRRYSRVTLFLVGIILGWLLVAWPLAKQFWKPHATTLAGQVVLNNRGVVLSWDHDAEHLFGYSAAEMVGREPILLFDNAPLTYQQHFDAMIDRLKNGPWDVAIQRIIPVELRSGDVEEFQITIDFLKVKDGVYNGRGTFRRTKDLIILEPM